MRTKPFRLLWVALLSLSGVLPTAADTSDWLPLAVGNSWTYEYIYHDYKNENSFYFEWLNYRTVEFNLSVLRTEVIDGHTYFVISDMPEDWPPVPRQFIAGKNLRWAGDHLMERTADGEQALFRFDAASGTNGEASYSVTIQGETIQVTARERLYDFALYDFIFSGGAGPVHIYDPYDAIDYLDLDATGELVRPMPNFGPALTFLKGFGVEVCVISHHDDDVTLFSNYQGAKHAEINGRTVTVQAAREESVAQLKASDATHTESNSWGAIKQEESK